MLNTTTIERAKKEFEFTYYSDLYYFAAFNHLINSKSDNKAGNFEFFKGFLYEYRISRNVSEKEKAWKIFKNSAKNTLNP